MVLPTQPYKGARDFYPGDKRLQKWMFTKLREVVEKYGYEEYDAPILEPLELYLSKTSEEIVREQTYSFADRGGRTVTLRPEMTPTVSRMVAAQRQELAYPLRWYSIPNVWRYERPQKGRLREHWQLNVDLFGVEGVTAELEAIQVADDIMKAFGAKPEMYEIRINSRKLLNERIKAAGVKSDAREVLRLIDGFDKHEAHIFKQKLAKLVEKPEELLDFLTQGQPNNEVKKIFELCKAMNIAVRFVPSLARGFDYYTDIVFEVFDKHPENNRSMFGGGRYDGLVELFGVEPVASVGFGMGDVTLQEFLRGHGLLPELKPETDAYVVIIGDVLERAQGAIYELRTAGLNIAVDFSGRKADKQIKVALKKGINYIVFIGEKELASGELNLKNLATGDEQRQTIGQIVSTIKDNRSK